MRQTLKLHPDSQCSAVTRIEVEVTRPSPGRLALQFLLNGKMSDLRLPPVTAPSRTDGLWQHTCFEAFLKASHSGEYYEFNFSPSTHWAAYRFEAYRAEMSVAREITAPRIASHSTGERYEFETAINLDVLPYLPNDSVWTLGLSAVIEETSGRKSYWALAHPDGQADFHHADCFAAEVPAA